MLFDRADSYFDSECRRKATAEQASRILAYIRRTEDPSALMEVYLLGRPDIPPSMLRASLLPRHAIPEAGDQKPVHIV